MAYSLFIDGAGGTTGLEIADRLAGRPEFALIHLDDRDRKDPIRRREAIAESDFSILCLPDAAARTAISLVGGHSRTRVIDASSAHRVATGWIYGLPELDKNRRAMIATAQRVSNPGCYASGFLLLIAPLVQAGLVAPTEQIICYAISGYSGGGKPLIARFEADRMLGYRGYALSLEHKHLSEMQHYSGLATPPLFAPAVVSVYRGMVVDIPLQFESAMASQIHSCLAQHYHDSTLITVKNIAELDEPRANPNIAEGMITESMIAEEIILRQDAVPSDRVNIVMAANAGGDKLRLIAHFDNLGKGASGACVQNLNLMASLDENTGLRV